MGKRGGEVKKMMNSGFRERERKEKNKRKNVFCKLVATGPEFVQKRSDSELSTSPLI